MDTPNKNISIDSLLDTIYTKEDLVAFYSKLETLQANIFKTGTKEPSLSDSISELFDAKTSDLILEVFKTHAVTIDKPAIIQDLLKNIKQIASTLPVLRIELSINPDHKLLTEMSEWFSKNCKRHVIMDIIYNPHVIGGIFISYNGLFFDGTLNSQIDSYFQK